MKKKEIIIYHAYTEITGESKCLDYLKKKRLKNAEQEEEGEVEKIYLKAE